MSISPLRRIAAVAAVAGVTALGGVALAPAALAAPDAPPAPKAAKADPLVVSLPDMTAIPDFVKPNDPGRIESPEPDAWVSFQSDKKGRYSATLPPKAAQVFQSVLANEYKSLGHLITFNQDGALVIGPKICDDTKSKDWNKGCLKSNDAPASRF
jgi:hypothetical protein